MNTELKDLIQTQADLMHKLEEGKKESLEKQDALQAETNKKIAEAVTEVAKQRQELEIAAKAQEDHLKRVESLELSFQGRSAGDGTKAVDKEFLAEQKASFLEALKYGQKSGRPIEVKQFRTDSNPDGGYFVRPEFVGDLITRSFETSPIRSVCSIRGTSSDTVVFNIADGQTSYEWGDQGGTITNTTTPTFGQKEIPIRKIWTKPSVTHESIEDPYFDLEGYLQGQVGDGFTRGENTSFAIGNHPLQPEGLLTLDPWAVAGAYERNKIEQIKSQDANLLTVAGLRSLKDSVHNIYRPNSVWLMKESTYSTILLMNDDTTYHFMGLQPSDREGEGTGTLLGKKVIFCEDFPDIAAGTLPIAYGDFKRGYTVIDRLGLTIIRDEITNDGSVVYKFRKRVGGGVTSFDSFKIQVIGA